MGRANQGKPTGDAELSGQTDLLGLPEAQPEDAPRAEVTPVTSEAELAVEATPQPDPDAAAALQEIAAEAVRTDGKRGDDGHGNVRPADSRFTEE